MRWWLCVDSSSMCPQHFSLWRVLDCRHLFTTALLALLLYLCLVATSGLGPGPAYREAASRANIVTHAALPDIRVSRCEHTAPLTVAVAGSQVSSPVSALVCQKEGDTMISAALHRDGSLEAGQVTAMLSAVASYPEAVFIGTQCLVTLVLSVHDRTKCGCKRSTIRVSSPPRLRRAHFRAEIMNIVIL